MCRKKIPKINSIHFGGKWICVGLLTAVVIPGIVWLLFQYFLWWMVVIGMLILAAFFIVFMIEMRQDNSKIPYYERTLRDKIPFDPEKQYAVIRSSICTGEKLAGFKNYGDAHFVEVMLINNLEDEKRFMKIYDINEVKREY